MQEAYRIGRHRGKCVLVWYENGERRRVSLGTEDAREAKRIAPAVWQDLTRPKAETVADLWNAYVRDLGDRAIVETMRHTWRALEDRFGALDPNDIVVDYSRDHIAERRASGISDNTIHTELGHLRMCLNWAQRLKYIPEAPYIERPPKPKSTTPHLTPAEVRRLLDAAKLPHVRLFVVLAYQTGGRAQALLDLTWDRVDFERGLIDLRNPAIKRPHKGRAVVPMTRTLRAALAGARPGAVSDYVIEWGGKPVKRVERGLAKAAKRAGLPKVTPHMFRHSVAVQAARKNRPATEIAQMLGHSNTKMVEDVYGRFRPEYLQGTLDALEIPASGTSVPKRGAANVA